MTTRTPQPSPRNPDPSICVALVHNNDQGRNSMIEPNIEDLCEFLGNTRAVEAIEASYQPDITPLSPGALMVGSHSVIGFWLMDCMRANRAASMVAAPLSELVQAVVAGKLRPLEGHVYPLSHARQAHEDMRARRTTGKVVLAPALDGARS